MKRRRQIGAVHLHTTPHRRNEGGALAKFREIPALGHEFLNFSKKLTMTIRAAVPVVRGGDETHS
jgi:hypothetical protein